MVTTRRQAASASSQDTGAVAAKDEGVPVTSKRTRQQVHNEDTRKEPKPLDPVPEVDADASVSPEEVLEEDDSGTAGPSDSDGAAYQNLIESILSGLGAPPAADASDSGESSSDDEDDSDMDTSEAVPSWMPDIPAPASASAHAVAENYGKPEGMAKLAVAPSQLSRADKRRAAKAAKETAGAAWYDMPAQEITPQVKQDWRLLRLRAAMDPRHFYKKFDSTKIPKFFQMGEIVEGAGEFYSSRMTKKERKQTLTQELLADIKLKRERKKRYAKLQDETQKWAKKRKKNQPKVQRSAHRPKH